TSSRGGDPPRTGRAGTPSAARWRRRRSAAPANAGEPGRSEEEREQRGRRGTAHVSAAASGGTGCSRRTAAPRARWVPPRTHPSEACRGGRRRAPTDARRTIHRRLLRAPPLHTTSTTWSTHRHCWRAGLSSWRHLRLDLQEVLGEVVRVRAAEPRDDIVAGR